MKSGELASEQLRFTGQMLMMGEFGRLSQRAQRKKAAAGNDDCQNRG